MGTPGKRVGPRWGHLAGGPDSLPAPREFNTYKIQSTDEGLGVGFLCPLLSYSSQALMSWLAVVLLQPLC